MQLYFNKNIKFMQVSSLTFPIVEGPKYPVPLLRPTGRRHGYRIAINLILPPQIY